jgi:hypothetical protein
MGRFCRERAVCGLAGRKARRWLTTFKERRPIFARSGGEFGLFTAAAICNELVGAQSGYEISAQRLIDRWLNEELD